jgi:hypothetical protein
MKTLNKTETAGSTPLFRRPSNFGSVTLFISVSLQKKRGNKPRSMFTQRSIFCGGQRLFQFVTGIIPHLFVVVDQQITQRFFLHIAQPIQLDPPL